MGANCSASASVGALFCLKCCNADSLRGSLAYMPPSSSSYRVEHVDDKDGGGARITLCQELRACESHQMAVNSCCVYWVETQQSEKIPIVWVAEHYSQSIASKSTTGSPAIDPEADIPLSPAIKTDSDCASNCTSRPGDEDLLYVLIHCHGNSTDIGMMMGGYWELAFNVGVVVVGVEYSGYGSATGSARLRNTYADVEAAYNLALDWGVPHDRIIVYGQSIGSGPAMWLAWKYPLAGLIFHSPFLSGIRVIDPEPEKCCAPSTVFSCFDFYQNIHRVKDVTCPVLIIHGQQDNVVPFRHGQDLYESCREESKFEPYFPEKAGHHDIVESDPGEYYNVVKRFLLMVENRRLQHNLIYAEKSPPKQVEMLDKDKKFVTSDLPPEVNESSWQTFGYGKAEGYDESQEITTAKDICFAKVQDVPCQVLASNTLLEKPEQEDMAGILAPKQEDMGHMAFKTSSAKISL